jgi:MoaA/NifB/PqqE/SkfB family radical SAM enzyme
MKLPLLSNISNFFPKLRPKSEKLPISASRPFRVVQIEVTSRCSTGCVFCPHDALSDRWVEGDIPLSMYSECIVPHLDLFELVYLQGWGEPMLHPDLWDMLSMAQEKGCRTGFTTNGTWLEDEQNKRLLDMGVDLISVSFAGTVASVHESLRTNSKFPMLCQNFESLANLKKQRGVNKLWLELHFLMTNLTYSPSLALDSQHVFGKQPLPEDVEMISQAKQTAERLNIPLRVYPLQAEPQTLVCDADPVNAVYINHKGDVTPCVYLGLTVQGQIPRFYQGEAHPFDTISFGNVCTGGFAQALQSNEREAFTSAFKGRNVGNNPLAMFTYLSAQSEAGELSPPPAPCQHCYKMLGV